MLLKEPLPHIDMFDKCKVCVYIWMYIYTYIHIYIYMYIYIYTCICNQVKKSLYVVKRVVYLVKRASPAHRRV